MTEVAAEWVAGVLVISLLALVLRWQQWMQSHSRRESSPSSASASRDSGAVAESVQMPARGPSEGEWEVLRLVKGLAETSSDSGYEPRWYSAVRELKSMDADVVVPVLVARLTPILRDGNQYRLRTGLIGALGELGDSRATDVLVRALTNHPYGQASNLPDDVREYDSAAIDALGTVGTDEVVVPVLLDRLMTVSSHNELTHIRKTLNKRIVEPWEIYRRIRPEAEDVVLEQLWAVMGDVGEWHEVPVSYLVEYASSPLERVRWGVAIASGTALRAGARAAGDPPGMAALRRLADDPERSVRWRAIRALGRAGFGEDIIERRLARPIPISWPGLPAGYGNDDDDQERLVDAGLALLSVLQGDRRQTLAEALGRKAQVLGRAGDAADAALPVEGADRMVSKIEAALGRV